MRVWLFLIYLAACVLAVRAMLTLMAGYRRARLRRALLESREFLAKTLRPSDDDDSQGDEPTTAKGQSGTDGPRLGRRAAG